MIVNGRRYSWTQPICDVCWVQQNPDRRPLRMKMPEAEVCAFCGITTYSGIYVRVDPSTVDFPSLRK